MEAVKKVRPFAHHSNHSEGKRPFLGVQAKTNLTNSENSTVLDPEPVTEKTDSTEPVTKPPKFSLRQHL